MTNPKVAFIGLGIMGSRMAHNLLKADVDVTVFNRSQEPVQELVQAGAKAGTSYQDTVQDADILITMLSKPEAVQEVVLGEEGALYAMKKGSLWVDSSTVNPSFAQSSLAVAQQKGIRYMDAPVAGTKPHAQNGELVFFVGGATDDLAEVEPLMNHMGRKVMHIGETTMGASFKMLVNALLGQSMLIFSETVLLGEKMGLDKEFLLNVLPNLVVSAPFTKAKSEMIKSGDYEVQFPLELMHKDMHLAAVTAYEHGQPLYLANLAKEVYAEALGKGLGRLDFAAIHEYLERK